MDTDHARVRDRTGKAEMNSGEQASAARAHDDGACLRVLFCDLQTDGRLSGDDIGVVERMDQLRAGGLRELRRRLQRVVHSRPAEAHVGAVRQGRLDLRQGRAFRHEDRGIHLK